MSTEAGQRHRLRFVLIPNTPADLRTTSRILVADLRLTYRTRARGIRVAAARAGGRRLDVHVFRVAGIVERAAIWHADRMTRNRSERAAQGADWEIRAFGWIGRTALVHRIKGQSWKALSTKGGRAIPHAHAGGRIQLVMSAAACRRGRGVIADGADSNGCVRGAAIDLWEDALCHRDRRTASHAADACVRILRIAVDHDDYHLSLLAHCGQPNVDLGTGGRDRAIT